MVPVIDNTNSFISEYASLNASNTFIQQDPSGNRWNVKSAYSVLPFRNLQDAQKTVDAIKRYNFNATADVGGLMKLYQQFEPCINCS